MTNCEYPDCRTKHAKCNRDFDLCEVRAFRKKLEAKLDRAYERWKTNKNTSSTGWLGLYQFLYLTKYGGCYRFKE